jgi:uncharacterized membrane protein
VIAWLRPDTAAQAAAQQQAGASFADVQKIVAARCFMCHGEQVQMKGIRLDSAAALKSHAQEVYQQAVVAKTMPMNNATGITEAERAVIGRWFEAGAPEK